MVKVRIKITQEHIDKGCRVDAQGCPGHLAFKEAGFYTSVTHFETYFYKPDDLKKSIGKVTNTKSLVSFVTDFDKAVSVKPISFILKLSEKFSKNFKINPSCIIGEK